MGWAKITSVSQDSILHPGLYSTAYACVVAWSLLNSLLMQFSSLDSV